MPANTRDSADPLLPGPFQHTIASTSTSNDPTSFDDDEYEPSAPDPLDKMGISYSTAKWLAPASFLFDFALQNYGMMSSPNMKQVHDANPAAFAPQPFGILGFFGPQQIFQLIWLRELFRREDQVERGTLRYVPWYALGNVMIGVWMFLWNSENLKGSNIPVAINTLTQLYYVFFLRNPQPSTYQSKLTNIINITFAGVGVLDLFHNTSAGYFKGIPPNTLVKVATSFAAPLTALVSPLLFGSCVAYDLFIVALGQHQLAQKALNGLGGGGGEGWAKLLGGVGLATLGVVGARAYQGARWV